MMENDLVNVIDRIADKVGIDLSDEELHRMTEQMGKSAEFNFDGDLKLLVLGDYYG